VATIEVAREDFGDPTDTKPVTRIFVVSLGNDPSPHPLQGCASTWLA